MKTWIRPGPGDAADQLAEVGPVLERREDLAELVALGELRGLHDVEQAVAEDLLDGGRVVLAQDPDDPLADAPGERAGPASSASSRASVALGAGWPSGRRRRSLSSAGDAVEGRLVDGVGLVERDQRPA